MILKTLKNTTSENRIDYLLIFLLISLSGNNAFDIPALMVVLTFSASIFFYRRKTFDVSFIFFIMIITFILLSQVLIFDFIPYVTLMGLYARIFMVYFIIKSIGTTFVDKFVKVMIFLSVMSLFFFILMNLIPELPNYMKPFSLKQLENVEETTGLFTASYFTPFHTFRYMPYNPINFVRNPGIFWEAGAFGGYLILTIILNIMRTGGLLNKQNIIFIITIFSTASTTSIVALMALSFFYLLASSKFKLSKTVLLPIISITSFFLFTYLDFLGAKVEDKIRLAENPSVIYTTTSSRFVDALRDIRAFEGHEFLGRGPNQETRFTKVDKQSGYDIRTNGFTDHLVKYGSVLFVLTFIYMFYSFLNIIKFYGKMNKLFAIYTILVIILILQSETYFNFPLFWGLLLLSTVYKINNKE